MHAHHDNHHRLNDERVAAWRAMPRRSGLDRLRRREAAKRAAWSLVGHLRCCHGWKGNSARLDIDDLVALHERDHAAR